LRYWIQSLRTIVLLSYLACLFSAYQSEVLKILTIQKTLENVSAGLISAYDKALK
jgi:hypothetical protein